ncbi:MAG TPA: VWA domain-containing protein [Bryobacteraceae bacterium]|nr:VWA domain-containing protein [Bryobacteraceae bacterium]
MRRVICLTGLVVLGARFGGLEMKAQDVTFTSQTNLVVIDVGVKDKSGKVIQDLKKGDFIILEDGKPQQVSVFEFQKLDSDAPPPPVPAIRPVRAPAEAAPAAAPKPAVPSGPKPIIRYQDRRLVAMLFDFSTMLIPEQVRAQKAAIEFLKTQMKPADLVAIMTAGTGPLKVEQEFTDDRDRLEEVVKTFRIGDGSDLATLGSNGDDTSGEDTGTAFNADETEFNIFNNDRKLATLETAAKLLAALPEKKALIYFSSGLEQQGNDNKAQLESAVNAAKRANVAFYPIDARGLTATAPAGDASSAGGRGTSALTGVAVSNRAASRDNSQETLSTLASDTGGRMFVDNNDLSMGMQKARDDISSYYIVGYYSTNGKTDGKFRRVQVKLANTSLQAKLDYKGGYFGEKEFRKFNSTDKENQLEQALMLGDPVTDLSVTGELSFFRLARDRYFVPFAVKIPGSEIALAKSKGHAQTELEFIGQLRDDHSKLVGVVRDGIKIKLAEQTAAQLISRPIAYETGFTVPPGTYTLKFLARENETGKMGTYETRLVIPDLAPDKPLVLKTSSVIWSNQRQALSDSIASVEKKKILEADPLVQDGQKLIPSITHVFRKDQNLYVYMEVYDPGLDANQKPSVAATLSFYRGRTKSFESEPVRLDTFLPKRGQTLPVRFQAPLAQLAAGRYICQINLIDETGRRFSFQRTEIVVLPVQKPVRPEAAAVKAPVGN